MSYNDRTTNHFGNSIDLNCNNDNPQNNNDKNNDNNNNGFNINVNVNVNVLNVSDNSNRHRFVNENNNNTHCNHYYARNLLCLNAHLSTVKFFGFAPFHMYKKKIPTNEKTQQK